MSWLNRIIPFLVLIMPTALVQNPAFSAATPPSPITDTTSALPFSNAFPVISYKQVVDLLDALEEGELDYIEDPKEIDHLLHFITYITEKGALFVDNAPLSEIDQDNKELLSNNDWDLTNEGTRSVLHDGERHYFTPIILSTPGTISLRESGPNKKVQQAKKHARKHIKTCIIGNAVVVGAIAVVHSVTEIVSAGAPALGQERDTVDRDKQRGLKEESFCSAQQKTELLFPSIPELPPKHAPFAVAIEEQIEIFRELDADHHYFRIANDSSSFGINEARKIGAQLAHQAIDERIKDIVFITQKLKP